MFNAYACGICEEVVDEESCPYHPELPVDLVLREFLVSANESEGRFTLFRNHVDDDGGQMCQTDSAEQEEAYDDIERLRCCLAACEGIPNDPLDRGYVQTLQDLATLVAEHLEDQNAESMKKLSIQMEKLEFRARCTIECGEEEGEGRN